MNSLALLYGRIGEKPIQDLVHHFYQQVALKPSLRALYPEDLIAAERRLYLFLLQLLGGPITYLEERGHPRLRMRHMQWQIDPAMRDQWMNAMLVALDKVTFAQEDREALMEYFTRAANAMINHD
jgi:hemoglobin